MAGIANRTAQAVLAIARRAMAHPKATKAFVSLGATALAAGATYLGIDVGNNESAESIAKKILERSGNPGTLAAAITEVLGAADPKTALAALKDLEDTAAESSDPDVVLSVLGSVRAAYTRALNTGDGRMGTVGDRRTAEYLKGYKAIEKSKTELEYACSSLGLTPKGLARVRAAILMDEDLFNATIEAM